MKKTLLFSVALAGLMLGSCSSSDDLNGGGTGNPGFNKDGNGFMSISVNLPTRSGSTTRAENDKYEDGLLSEYEVKNGILALFDASSKTSEGDYTLLAAYKLDLTDSELDTDGDNITSTHSVVTQIKSTTATDVYALVLLNDNSILTASDGKLLNGTEDLTGKTYNYILALTTENAMTSTGFFMANAPVSATPGNASAPDGRYTTLSKVDLSKIKETRNEAINDPAVSVFVERGVAKVSLNSIASGTTSDDKLPYTFDGWVLDNTTKSSYIVRNMGTAAGTYLKYSSEKFTSTPNYRFVGDTKLGDTSKQPDVALYRTYWCVDPTYAQTFNDAATHTANFNTVTSAAEVTSWLTSGKYVYCHENTFDVAHMDYSNTTRALVKVTFNDGKKFYTNNGANAILDTDGKRDDAVMSYVLGTDINIVDLKKYLSDNQKPTGTVTWSKADFDLTWATTPDKDGILKVTDIKLSATGKAKLNVGSPDFTGWDAIKDQLNTNRVIRQYDNGASYYEVRIKHFAGDDAGAGDLAPWNTWETVKPSASEAYPGKKEQNYLGRYGLVRNNWYDIDVTAIKKIGSPVVPDITTDNTPDDNIDAYISAKINVLSWAKRTQSTILGK